MYREIIVVEGKDDTVAIRRAIGADTIETGGSAIGEEVLKRIELAQQRRGVIIFTDPDSPGERIRKIVAERVPGARHAFLTRDEARGRHGMGVEHASDAAIRRALEAARTPEEATVSITSHREGNGKSAASGSHAVGISAAAHGTGTDLNGEEIAWADLLAAGLIVHKDAAKRRARMGELLGIGYANGKQFHKRCTMFRITSSEFAQALAQLEKEGLQDS